MRKRLGRAMKVAGIPVTTDTAKSLSQAAMDILTNSKATLKERERRYNICRKCPDRKNDRCGLCGCFIKSKTILANSECPVGKWSTLSGEAAVNDARHAEKEK